MKIAFPIIKANTGADNYFHMLSRGLQQRAIYTEVIELSYSNEFIPTINRKVRAKLKQFDVVHSSIDHASLFSNPKQPLVSTLLHDVLDVSYQKHTSLAQKAYHYGILRNRIRKSLLISDSLICISNSTKSSFLSTYGNYRYEVIYPGIDLERFRSGNLERNTKQLVLVGTASIRKGIDYIDPLMQLLGPEYTLYFVTKSKGVTFKQSNIEIVNDLSDSKLVELYNSSTFVISLSRLEGFGYTVAEGMACGCCIVAWNNSSIPELCQEGLSGHLIEEGDIGSFAKAIVETANNSEKISRISKFNAQWAIENFSNTTMLDKYINNYERLLENSKFTSSTLA